jgi:hypothetical protein
MNCDNHKKIYIIENKIVTLPEVASVVKKRGDKKLGPMFYNLLKTNIERMSVFRLSTILMKGKVVTLFSPRC